MVSLPSFLLPSQYRPYEGPHPMYLDRGLDPFVYPIRIGQVGPHQPLFSGPLQYPFLCEVEQSGLGQPLVDNHERVGVAVYQTHPQMKEKTHVITGYSQDCLLPTKAFYYYNKVGTDLFFPLEKATDDIAKIKINGKEIDFVVRVEVGTINRFIYSLAVIRGMDEDLAKPNGLHWNSKLIYQFRGGVGIGKRQGKLKPSSFLGRRKDLLEQGYAIAYSTANKTSNHYNLWLAEEVMMRVKKQFVALYGEPSYTIGIGGSGGAIQQLIIGQNHPGLLDGALLLYAYPDMITQTIYAFDCELLEYYFDVMSHDNSQWQTWSNRTWVQGLNAKEDFSNEFSVYYNLARLVNGIWPPIAGGMTECINGWRGLTQLTNNPRFTHLAKYYDDAVIKQTHWTHWDDLKHIYGTGANGYANQTWDNVGVQYGLNALKQGYITIEDFLDLNFKVGGWKPPELFEQEKYWKIVPGSSLFDFSPWSHHNMFLSDGLTKPAARTQADSHAIKAAYQSGQVFLGKLEIPTIDLRHYLEEELDMHHVSASFSIRTRIMEYHGHADHHVMWVTKKPHEPIVEAVDYLGQWIISSRQAPTNQLALVKPEALKDTCFDEKGQVLAAGSTVWDGQWNGRADGACLKHYKVYQNSRLVAGDGWRGDMFKCQLQSVRNAIKSGVYGKVDVEPYLEQLELIFPQGVCDYSQEAVGRLRAKN